VGVETRTETGRSTDWRRKTGHEHRKTYVSASRGLRPCAFFQPAIGQPESGNLASESHSSIEALALTQIEGVMSCEIIQLSAARDSLKQLTKKGYLATLVQERRERCQTLRWLRQRWHPTADGCASAFSSLSYALSAAVIRCRWP
jgi:hypothetical protein